MLRAEQIWDEIPFLSTPSARRATGDKARYKLALSDFYPRPPRGGRQFDQGFAVYLNQFLSTPSARRATCGR